MHRMHAKMKSHPNYQAIKLMLNGNDLLRVIKLFCFNIEDEKYIPQKVYEVKVALYALKQGRDSNQDYHTKFLNILEVIKQCGVSLGEYSLICKEVCKVLNCRSNTGSSPGGRNHQEIEGLNLRNSPNPRGADPKRYSNMIRASKTHP